MFDDLGGTFDMSLASQYRSQQSNRQKNYITAAPKKMNVDDYCSLC